MNSKKRFLALLALCLLTTSSFAAGVNPFELAKDSFFELAGNYVFIIIVAVIIFIVGIEAMRTQSMTPLYWGAVGIFCIAIIPTLAPGAIDFFKAFTPAAGPSVTP
jgi:hypothetical protein